MGARGIPDRSHRAWRGGGGRRLQAPGRQLAPRPRPRPAGAAVARPPCRGAGSPAHATRRPCLGGRGGRRPGARAPDLWPAAGATIMEALMDMLWWHWIAFGLVLAGFEMLTPGGFFVVFFGVGALLVGLLQLARAWRARRGCSGCCSRSCRWWRSWCSASRCWQRMRVPRQRRRHRRPGRRGGHARGRHRPWGGGPCGVARHGLAGAQRERRDHCRRASAAA